MRQNKKRKRSSRKPKKGSICVYRDKSTGKWRVQYTRPDGKRPSQSFNTEVQAQEVATMMREQLEAQAQTIGQAIDLYLTELTERETTRSHQVSVRCQLNLMFPNPNRHLTELDAMTGQRLYDNLRKKGKSVDYQRNCLLTSRSMCKWLRSNGIIPMNPFAEVEGKGKRKKGKAQLTIDESRRFLDACLTYEHPLMRTDGRNKMRTPRLDPQVGITAAMCCLLLGVRCSEIVRMTPRAIDDGGTVLRIFRSATKSDAGARLLDIPEVLRSRMPALAATTISRHQINNWVHRMCKVAGVTDVCPHGLRGTHASLARGAGATGQLVSAALGHASETVTTQHYTSVDETAKAEVRSALTALNWEGAKVSTEVSTECTHQKRNSEATTSEFLIKPNLLN